VTLAYSIVPGVAGLMAFGSFKSMAASKIQILVLGTSWQKDTAEESFRCTEIIRDKEGLSQLWQASWYIGLPDDLRTEFCFLR
jgi:hypothetical protein